MKASELRGEPLRVFDTWRSLGMSESTAMEQLRRDGLLPPDEGGALVGVFRSLGLSEAAATRAAAGRGGAAGAAPATSNSVALSEALSAYGAAWIEHYGARPGEASDLAKLAGRRIWESTVGGDAWREAETVRLLMYEARVLIFSADKPWPRDRPAVKPIRETRASSRSKPARRNLTGG